ncbi:putative glycolipid-binding domain-containing protein [Nocardia suismassiliense]|uniref:putative glycolipid-binding domain-containing protein n=1 Tax=Nocardia suismassiliense TaxID=2077092 RepID=UPI000D1DE526|nr:putative glycolipid-binding domain-containing protein [Nocardia suismassiliense]
MFEPAPQSAAWQHRGARTGFEIAYFKVTESGVQIDGCATAVEDGRAWAVDYQLTLDPSWHTRRARVATRCPGGWHTVALDTDGAGNWTVDGVPHAGLSGCLDVDLEASALTNAFPVHRLGLDVEATIDAPAAYVHAAGLEVTRLEQVYRRIADDGSHQRFAYQAPQFDFRCTLTYDESGFVLDYPGIAIRAH